MPTYRRLLIAWLFVPIHRLLFRVSRGRLLNSLKGNQILVLVTRGRKSGKLHSSPLIYFQFEGSRELIVVASNYGQDHHPAWFLNAAANPSVTVETEHGRFAAQARITQGEERAALFGKVIAASPRYACYLAATDRQIPVVALTLAIS